jgi:hypothetical protein
MSDCIAVLLTSVTIPNVVDAIAIYKSIFIIGLIRMPSDLSIQIHPKQSGFSNHSNSFMFHSTRHTSSPQCGLCDYKSLHEK